MATDPIIVHRCCEYINFHIKMSHVEKLRWTIESGIYDNNRNLRMCSCDTQRWYIDGTVECFVNEHIPLAVGAILVLVFCAFIIAFLTVVARKKNKVHIASYVFVL